MMVESATRKNKNEVIIRAVDNNDKSLTGIVKLSGRTGGSNIKGICYLFSFESEKLFFYDNYMFFFGDYKHLKENYHNSASIPKLNLENFNFEDNLLIPLDLLKLSSTRLELVRETVEYSKNKLFNFVKNLEKYKQELNKKYMLSSFSKYPDYIRKIARRNGYYFLGNYSNEKSTNDF